MKVLLRILLLFNLLLFSSRAEVVKVLKGKVRYEGEMRKVLLKSEEKLRIGKGRVCTEKEEAVLLLPDESEITMKPRTCLSIEDVEEKPAIFLFFGRIINRIVKVLSLSEIRSPHSQRSIGSKGNGLRRHCW